MTFPNAYQGVKKIFLAQILALISVAALLITSFAALGTIGAAAGGSDAGAVAGLGITAIFGIGYLVLALLAFIFQIIGISKASKDEPAFKIALYLIIAGIAVSIIGGFMAEGSVIKSIFTVATDVINLAITVYVIQGIRNLAVKLGNTEMDNKGNNIFKIIIAVYVCIFIARIVSMISGGTATSVIAAVFAIIAAVLSIIQYVIYLIYLNKAKAMLA